MGEEDGRPRPERFREYLMMLARVRLGGDGRGRVDASDVVQQTLVEAVRSAGEFRGQGDAEMAAWLRRLLAFNLIDAFREQGRAKRDRARERSLEAALEESSARLGALLASEQTTPSQAAERHEEAVRLADALAALPEGQRQAIELRYGQGLGVAEIGRVMERGPEAVAGLLKRGLQGLRAQLIGEERA